MLTITVYSSDICEYYKIFDINICLPNKYTLLYNNVT